MPLSKSEKAKSAQIREKLEQSLEKLVRDAQNHNAYLEHMKACYQIHQEVSATIRRISEKRELPGCCGLFQKEPFTDADKKAFEDSVYNAPSIIALEAKRKERAPYVESCEHKPSILQQGMLACLYAQSIVFGNREKVTLKQVDSYVLFTYDSGYDKGNDAQLVAFKEAFAKNWRTIDDAKNASEASRIVYRPF